MKVGSMFAGIGGLDLGLTRAGMEVAWQVEVDDFCRSILARHFPSAVRFGDVHDVNPRDVERVDLICAGYPCQPFSLAGKRGGEDDPRHLWPVVREWIRTLEPRWVLLENVAGHLSKGFGQVLGEMAELGFDAEWHCLRAQDVGAPHRRKRVFMVAAHADRAGLPIGEGLARDVREELAAPERGGAGPVVRGAELRWRGFGPWAAESPLLAVADGIPDGLARPGAHALKRWRRQALAAAGNAVVPQIAEWIGRRIMAADRGTP